MVSLSPQNTRREEDYPQKDPEGHAPEEGQMQYQAQCRKPNLGTPETNSQKESVPNFGAERDDKKNTGQDHPESRKQEIPERNHPEGRLIQENCNQKLKDDEDTKEIPPPVRPEEVHPKGPADHPRRKEEANEGESEEEWEVCSNSIPNIPPSPDRIDCSEFSLHSQLNEATIPEIEAKVIAESARKVGQLDLREMRLSIGATRGEKRDQRKEGENLGEIKDKGSNGAFPTL